MPDAPWRVFGTKAFFRLWLAQCRLEPRRLDRAHRHPRHRGAGVRQLGRRGQPGDDDPRAAGLPARHRRRRHHRPLRPPQGDGAVRHRARQPPRAAARSSTASPGCCSSRSGSRSSRCCGARRRRHRCRTSCPRSSCRRRTRCRSPRATARSRSRRSSSRCSPGVATVLGELDVISVVQGRPGSARADLRRDDVPRVGGDRLPPPDPAPRPARTTSASTGPRPSARSRKGCSSSSKHALVRGRHARPRLRPHRRGRDDPARSELRPGGAQRRRRRVRRAR